ncbi:MFS transporter [Acidianus sulfidivorans JP7]|uniref:MFS transporter n=1 Tax=Acidianus sulfidivorans JP7 TaxID=619593 RepID=A0A2U9ILX9_9CREN|nr:MFS transporter [Acidianus sulfidivorans]AWR97005.1 MFS transporter [Acidianus sulfidivorans JP7]
MKVFIGQTFITIVLTELSLVFPVQIYSETHSILLLGIITTIYNALNALGSYIWGDILDGNERRFEFVLLLPLSIIAISPFIFYKNEIVSILSYGLLGFFTALDSPLYSLIILENFSIDEMPKANSRLSQMTLIGNVVGSVIASFHPSENILLLVLFSSVVSSILFNRKLKGVSNKNKSERLSDLKRLNNALLSFFSFNFAAEIFFTLYIPLNYLMKNPEYFIFLSYAILYTLDEISYSMSIKLVKNSEQYYIYFTLFLRDIISLIVSLIILSNIRIGVATIPIFLAFGSIYPLYSTSFFTLIFRGLKRNRATILGIFNSTEDIASIFGSLIGGIVGDNNLWGAYLTAFYVFTLSAFLMARHLRNFVSSS